MFSRIFVLIFFILYFIPSISVAFSNPLDQTKAFVAAMKSVKNQGEKSYPKIDEFINFDHITSETIQPHIKAFSQDQIDSFKPLLEKLIRMVAYPKSGDFYSDSTYHYQKPQLNGNSALVNMDVVFEKEDLEIELGYYWQKNKNQWFLTDLSFDEDSLVKDYQNQFGRIINKEGVDYLIQRLKDKIIEIEKDKK